MNEKLSDFTKTIDNGPGFNNLIHLTLLIESWVNRIALLASEKKIDSNLIISNEILNRKYNPLNNIISFTTQTSWEINKKINQYSKFWKIAYSKLNKDQINSFWKHPDFLPTINDIKNPEKFLKSQSSNTIDNIDKFIS
jgi:uncharacterized protein (DUF2342 family)